MIWAYGVTTVPSRLDTLLPKTLDSLRRGGFDKPWLFVDGAPSRVPWEEFGLEITTRYPNVNTAGNWTLSLFELFIRNPQATHYALFQDDLIMSKNARQYLEHCTKTPLPTRGYYNLYTFPQNQKLCRDKVGWVKSNQRGLGAVALVFEADVVTSLLSVPSFVERCRSLKRGWRSIDGGVVTALKKVDVFEYIHNPSLTQHTGSSSTMGNKRHPNAVSFHGEEFDTMSLI